MSSPAISHALISDDVIAAEFNHILNLSDIIGLSVSADALVDTTSGSMLTDTATNETLEES